MKLRFGEFPEDHHFISLTRPLVEWTFKFLGWLLLTSTIQFAYLKTGNQFLLYLKLLCYGLLLAFVGAFVDWFLSFRRHKIVSGQKLAEEAESKFEFANQKRPSNDLKKLRQVAVVAISVLATLVLVGASNFATERIIDAFIEFQRNSK